MKKTNIYKILAWIFLIITPLMVITYINIRIKYFFGISIIVSILALIVGLGIGFALFGVANNKDRLDALEEKLKEKKE